MENKLTYILAIDPGSVNFGCAVVDPARMKILAHGLNPFTITGLKPGVSQQLEEYTKFLRALKDRNCVYAVAERFQSRGLQGMSVELVNVMLGVLLTEFPGKCRLLIASQWKNSYGRGGLDLKNFYLTMRPVTPHQIDACLMGVWLACKLQGTPLPEEQTLRNMIRKADQPSVAQQKEFRKAQRAAYAAGKKQKKTKRRARSKTTAKSKRSTAKKGSKG